MSKVVRLNDETLEKLANFTEVFKKSSTVQFPSKLSDSLLINFALETVLHRMTKNFVQLTDESTDLIADLVKKDVAEGKPAKEAKEYIEEALKAFNSTKE